MQFKPERYESTFFINDVTVRLLHSSDSEGFAKRRFLMSVMVVNQRQRMFLHRRKQIKTDLRSGSPC